jgi:biotin transport system substrate-specific component
MTSIRSTVADWRAIEIASSRPVRMAIGAVVFATATALSAKIQVVIPNTPVPFTFQPLLVLLSGALLGGRLGASSQLLYLMAGVLGVPVFAFGGGAAYLLGATGGYLLAYPLAAMAVGALMGPGYLRTVVAMLAGLAIIYAGGVAWLAAIFGTDSVLALGLVPFILADLVKVALGVVVAKRLRSGSLSLFGVR